MTMVQNSPWFTQQIFLGCTCFHSIILIHLILRRNKEDSKRDKAFHVSYNIFTKLVLYKTQSITCALGIVFCSIVFCCDNA